jgi:diguanylate cyclase (GGDEF)-like protein
MYVLLASGVLLAATQYLHDSSRRVVLVEAATVLAAGFMLIWYFVVEPIVDHQRPSYVWTSSIGAPLGDLLLIAAVATVLLRSAGIRFGAPAIVLTAGLACYLVSDVTWAAVGVGGERAAKSLFASMSVVIACLLLTLAPMLVVHRPSRASGPRSSSPPAWAGYLSISAMAVACTLMMAVAAIEGHMLPWGGLVGGLTVMICAAGARQMMSLRECRDLIVHDPLTALASRTGLEWAIERALKRPGPVALLLIDLDGFKLINDAYGYAAGDIFLTEFAHHLRSAVRAGHTPARVGGDEFAMVLTDSTAEHATAVARRILSVAAANPTLLDNDIVPVRTSIGIASAEPGDTADSLMRRADVAMYHCKRAGTHTFAVYDPTMIDRRSEDAALSGHLDSALNRGELHVLYQPLVDLSDGMPIAAEALIRWQHPTRGLVSPVQFIPIAERSGAITRIGLWVLEQALQHLKTFQDQAPADRPMHISVNLSPRQLQEPTIVHDILAVLHRTDTDPCHLVLEVTESALVNETSGIAALRALRTHGIRIAIDDFGTGYSSLQYLTRLPVDILKIDRSFVAELNGTPEGASVTEAILRLSQVLHLTTVAEGIETPQQASELQELGCDTGQGYLYAKPLPAAELADLLGHRMTAG